MSNQKITIGVIGGHETDEKNATLAYQVGEQIAKRGITLVCGGLGGIMEAASKGAFLAGGIVVGVLPGHDKQESNQYVTIALPTGMGLSRDALVVRFSDALIAFPGSYGTLAEIAFALTLGKTVVYMPGAWNLKKIGRIDANLFKEAFDANQAIGLALNSLIIGAPPTSSDTPTA